MRRRDQCGERLAIPRHLRLGHLGAASQRHDVTSLRGFETDIAGKGQLSARTARLRRQWLFAHGVTSPPASAAAAIEYMRLTGIDAPGQAVATEMMSVSARRSRATSALASRSMSFATHALHHTPSWPHPGKTCPVG